MDSESDSEYSHVYCSYPVRDITLEDIRREDADRLIIELRDKVKRLEKERDIYKNKASFLSKMYGKTKKATKNHDNALLIKKKSGWVSMTDKRDIF